VAAVEAEVVVMEVVAEVVVVVAVAVVAEVMVVVAVIVMEARLVHPLGQRDV
jgi:hypothetical protein